jgi:transcriptional regulator with XRE-family HTH domain
MVATMTPAELRARREALGLSQSQLGAMLWEKPQSGRVTVVSLESGKTPMSKRMAAWLNQELARLEAGCT